MSSRILYPIVRSLCLLTLCFPLPTIGYTKTLPPPLKNTLYSFQYSLAKMPPSFTRTKEALDAFLGLYTTQYFDKKHVLRYLSSQRRKIKNSSYLWQEIMLQMKDDEAKLLIQALLALSPRITLKQYHNSYTIYIDTIPTHLLHITPPVQTKPSTYLTIIIDDVGENYLLLKEFIQLSLPLTFAIWPFASASQSSAKLLHSTQQTTIIHLPMEPLGYPKINPGKGSLTLQMSPYDVKKATLRALHAIPYAIGINNHMGSSFTSNLSAVQSFVDAVHEINPKLYIIDSMTHAHSVLYNTAKQRKLRSFERNIFIDNTRTVEYTLQQLYKAEKFAQKHGKAIAIGHLANTTLEALKIFMQKRNKEVSLITLQDYALLQ